MAKKKTLGKKGKPVSVEKNFFNSSIAKIVFVSMVFGLVGGSVSFFALSTIFKPSNNDLIKEWYDVENLVHVSPHSLRKSMDKGENNFVLVDLRSAQEYEQEHIIGAINIPAYSDPNTSAYGDVNRIVGGFSKLSKDKDIIVYCYSMPCMTGRKIGKMLAEHGIFVKHLGIGWNEWKYYWNLWNHELDYNSTNPADYVIAGKEPGIPKVKSNPGGCPLGGEFGC